MDVFPAHEGDAPVGRRLGDLIEQLQDYFAMLNGVAETLTGDAVQRFDWRVVGLSKNSPARVTVEAVPLPGHKDGPEIAARARDITAHGLRQLLNGAERPTYFSDNVIEAADRFVRRITRGLSETKVTAGPDSSDEVSIGTASAVKALTNITVVRESDPVHPYRELGSFEGHIQNVGTDGWARPFIIVKSRLTGENVKCFLSGEALKELENEPVANVVWRNRRVNALGILKYRSVGRLSQAEVTKLDFADKAETLPQLKDIIDRGFTDGLPSEVFIERVRNGEA